MVDDAIKRKGRLGDHLEVPPPDEEARKEIFNIHLKKLKISLGKDFSGRIGKIKGEL